MAPLNQSFRQNPLEAFLQFCSRINRSGPLCKTSIVAGGYALGALIAGLAVLGAMLLSGPSSVDDCGGAVIMGSALLFCGVFTVATIPSACGGFYFLRGTRGFWNLFAPAALVFAASGLVALALIIFMPLTMPAGLSFPRILIAPVAGLGFFLGGIFAPTKQHRMALLGATALEVVAFGGWLASCLLNVALGHM